MHAMLIDENKNLVWSEVAEPVLSDTQVLIEIHAAALNRADLLQREGKYPSPKGCPPWMGLEVAGEIIEIGKNVTKWKVGDKVCALLGGIVLLAAGLLLGGKMSFSLDKWYIFAYICGASIFSYCIWFGVVKKGDLSKLFIIKFAEPIFACIFGALILR